MMKNNDPLISIVSFRALKEESSPLYYQVINWIKSMEEVMEGENGEDFYKWIEDNLNNQHPFDTYILTRANNLVLGMASIAPDDECAGEQLNIQGIWLAGVYINTEHRGQGFGRILINFIDDTMKQLAKKDDKAYTLNLFSKNPIAISIYKKRGFMRLDGLLFNYAGHENEVYSKKYDRTIEKPFNT